VEKANLAKESEYEKTSLRDIKIGGIHHQKEEHQSFPVSFYFHCVCESRHK
jgi:hypothetical protein